VAANKVIFNLCGWHASSGQGHVEYGTCCIFLMVKKEWCWALARVRLGSLCSPRIAVQAIIPELVLVLVIPSRAEC
jgi:hypothetical protein